MKSSLRAVAIPLLTFAVTISASGQDHKKVNCKGEFDYSKSKITLSADYMKQVSANFSTEPQTAAVDKWTVAMLSQQRSLCESYKASTEQQFPTSLYLEQMNQLRAWEIDFMKISLGAQQAQAAQVDAAKGGKGPTVPIHSMQQSVANKIKDLVQTRPNVSIPATAVKVDSFPDEPL